MLEDRAAANSLALRRGGHSGRRCAQAAGTGERDQYIPSECSHLLREDGHGQDSRRSVCPLTDAYNTLQTFLGGLYVNDFNLFGRVWQVLVQAEPDFRSQPTDIARFFVRNSDGEMVPLSTLAHGRAHQRSGCSLSL